MVMHGRSWPHIVKIRPRCMSRSLVASRGRNFQLRNVAYRDRHRCSVGEISVGGGAVGSSAGRCRNRRRRGSGRGKIIGYGAAVTDRMLGTAVPAATAGARGVGAAPGATVPAAAPKVTGAIPGAAVPAAGPRVTGAIPGAAPKVTGAIPGAAVPGAGPRVTGVTPDAAV